MVRADGEVTVQVRLYDRTLILLVTGEIDLVTAPTLGELLNQALDQRPEVLVVDLSTVRFLGSAGLAVLVHAHDRARDSTRIRIVAATPETTRPLEVTGLITRFTVCPTLQAALGPAPEQHTAG